MTSMSVTRALARVAVIGVLAACAGCGHSSEVHPAGSPPTSPDATSPDAMARGRALQVVALGDSDTTGVGDPSGRGWVGRYADLLRARLGVPVTVQNLALEGQTSNELRAAVGADPTVRRALRGAEVVLIAIGGADLNAGDAALAAGTCRGRSCYAPLLRRFAANLSAVAGEVRLLAPRAVLRATDLPNAFPGGGSVIPSFATAGLSSYTALNERHTICQAITAHAGRCVDVLSAFNGPHGTSDAYVRGLMTKNPCCYPSAKGQQLIAHLLVRSGTAGPS